MKRMHLCFITRLMAFFIFLLFSGMANAEPIKIIYSTYFPVSYDYLVSPVIKFAKKVENQSKGRVKIKIYHSKQLFGGKEEFEALKEGKIDMSAPNFLYHTDIIPEYGIVSLPFLYDSHESLQKIIDNGLYDLGIKEKLLENNIVFLSAGVADPYQFYSTDFQVMTPYDIAGKSWAVSGDTHKKAIEFMKGKPITMGSSKLYMSFQRGVIDGTTRPLVTGRGRKLYETVDYISINNFSFLSSDLCINKKKWDSLPEDIQEIIRKAARERTQEQAQMVKKYTDETIKFFRKKGVEVHMNTKKEVDKFRKAMQPVYDWWLTQVPDGKKYIDFVKEHQK